MTIDDLGEFGLARMTDGEIRGFLSSQAVGVLALPTGGAPSLRPLSFGYDGESALYLPFVVGSGSRKATLSDAAEAASVLVYEAETRFNWRSVLLTGTIEAVPEGERGAVLEATELAWRPELFERAGTTVDTRLYRFGIEEMTGVKHLGLPPGFEVEAEG